MSAPRVCKCGVEINNETMEFVDLAQDNTNNYKRVICKNCKRAFKAVLGNVTAKAEEIKEKPAVRKKAVK